MNFWETYPFGDERGGAQGSDGRGSRGFQGSDGRTSRYSDAGAGTYGGSGMYGASSRSASDDSSHGAGCDFYERLGGFTDKSEEQLMSELMSAVDRMKAEGSFDPASLERLYLTASPFLSEGQRERMRRIIDMLIK